MSQRTETQPTTTASLDERLFEAAIGTLELFGVYLGTRLALYEHLAGTGPMTPRELAQRAGIDARYAREWCEQQAVAGFLEVEDLQADAEARRYELPAGHVGVLVDRDDPTHVAPFADMVVGIAGVLDEVVEAYRSGGGVPYPHYGAAFRRGQGGINRPAFLGDLPQWLAAAGLDDVLAREGTRIADVGCGQGWSTIAMAASYPGAEVVGYDADRASVADANEVATQRSSTARFVTGDAGQVEQDGPFDLVVLLEVLHDLADPVGVLAACRAALRAGGTVLVADENVAESFTAPGDELERMMYGWSIAHCLPATRADAPDGIGTVLRPAVLRELGTAAGFTDVEVVDVDAGFFRLYTLRG